MSETSFEPTPLFQLNLMLFLAWPSSPSFVDPVFWKEGFTLRNISPDFSVPAEAIARAQASDLPIQQAASPEMLLERSNQRQLLLIECKISSFGTASSTARQARALLSCHGPFLAGYLGVARETDWESYLLYALKGEQEGPMQNTLTALGKELALAHIETAKSSSVGIHIRPGGVYLLTAFPFNVPIQTLQQSTDQGIRVMTLEEGEYPRPLYLIPLDPSVGVDDPVEKQVLEERVRQSLASLIGSHLDLSSFDITIDEILMAVTEVWALWKRSQASKGFHNAVRKYVNDILHQLRQRGASIESREHHFSFSQVTPDSAQKLRRYLTSMAFRKGDIDLWSDAVQLDFSSVTEGW